MHPKVDCCNIGKVPKVSVQAHAFILHAEISCYFTQIVNMNEVETCMHNKCDKCMGLYGNLTVGSTVVAHAAGRITNAGECSQ